METKTRQKGPEVPARPALHRHAGKLVLLILLMSAAAWGGYRLARTPAGGAALAAAGLPAEPAVDPAPATPPPGVEVPDGMVYVPGGLTQIGSQHGLPSEQPVFATEVAPFFMDRHPVTVAQFRAFVEATGYVTDAERFGSGAVLGPDGQWRLAEGADWRRPMGPAGPAAPDDHPVTQVSWNDATAYARWAGKRLPTEVEWEHAARGARDARHPYSWGPSLVMEGRYRANTWQGRFPERNRGEDGFLHTSPVGAFGTSVLGLTDMGGNVWEWCEDWYRSYADRGQPFHPAAESEKAQRGGSFLCNEDFCHGYRVSARSHSTPESSLFHVGFRTVQDLP